MNFNMNKHFPVLSSFMTYHRICNQINTTGTISGAGTAYNSGAPAFTPDFQWGSCYSIFSCMCIFCRSLFVLLYFFFWSLQSVLLRYTDSDYPFGYLQALLKTQSSSDYTMIGIKIHKNILVINHYHLKNTND